ncbi:hypothetical protein EVAR_77844_1 [Eumeta japonica]|uniref:Uncharacterized protein n=1 Tax=Eumeta variegata TaxID=151549 RepID=A0A4C1TC46_EUMVA|nr:hypothetical protein EVAR_77844_1 [Eumeta japonica]
MTKRKVKEPMFFIRVLDFTHEPLRVIMQAPGIQLNLSLVRNRSRPKKGGEKRSHAARQPARSALPQHTRSGLLYFYSRSERSFSEPRARARPHRRRRGARAAGAAGRGPRAGRDWCNVSDSQPLHRSRPKRSRRRRVTTRAVSRTVRERVTGPPPPRAAWIGRDWCNIGSVQNIAPVTARPRSPLCAAPSMRPRRTQRTQRSLRKRT